MLSANEKKARDIHEDAALSLSRSRCTRNLASGKIGAQAWFEAIAMYLSASTEAVEVGSPRETPLSPVTKPYSPYSETIPVWLC